MSLILKNVYNTTKTKYHLKCITGNECMNKIMNWVYISEDFNNSNFLQGGELVITTGVCLKNEPAWLYNFISHMIDSNVCGIILNIGKYINPEDISDDIIALCQKNNMTLFTMPWDVHIYDISREYYNMIFLDSQTDHAVSEAFSSVLRRDNNYQKSISILAENGFNENYTYYICTIKKDSYDKSYANRQQLCNEQSHTKTPYRQLSKDYVYPTNINIPENPHWSDIPNSTFTDNKTEYNLKRMLHAYNMNCHILSYPKYFHLIFCNETHNRIIRFITSDIIKGITNVHTGLSGACNTLSKLDTCCHQSVFTCMMAHNTGLPYYDYETMGFYKVLFAVNDRLVLSDYVEQYLGKLKEYDNRHNSEYTETLHQYLLHNGSIQTIANEMNCHRNTINYRINILKESFGFDPDNQQKKFELMCAYTINDFLKLCFIENGV